ncbi:bis-aminopropyl spermidine synthase family protein [Pseudomonas sp. RHF3.3-3]|uniref:bis-aminopropyl spermidine synthase family protein n=1 Tax=Pseudomonas sp. RHF3.3-3 TaxID=3396624 RepID=UPI003A8A4D32
MHNLVQLRERLLAHLPARLAAPAQEQAALDDLLSKLTRPRRIHQLLSSRLTVRQILHCLVELLAEGQLQLIREQAVPQLVLGTPLGALPGHGLHLVDDACLRLEPRYREVMADLLSDKKSIYDQSIETFETQIRRYKIMQSLGDLNHGNLLLLGDDALFSLFLALHGYRQRIVVADIDRDLLATIERTCRAQAIDTIEVVEYDVFQPLPEQLQGRFDCFAVNGFKDLGGLLTFICRGVQSLAPTADVGYVNFGNHEVQDATQRAMEVQIHQALLRFGLYMDHCVPCAETHVSEAFEQAMLHGVLECAALPGERRAQACEQWLETLAERFADLSWVRMHSFPDIQLSPLKLGRCRVASDNRREVSRFLRLSQLYARSTPEVA